MLRSRTRELCASLLRGRTLSTTAVGSAPAQSSLRRYGWLVPALALPVAVASDEGLSRSVYFNAHALPALAHYRLTEWWLRRQGASEAETEAALQPLHDRYAPLSLHVILKLRGFYIKLGQIGATRSDFVAPQYIERCETLYDTCPYEPLEYVQALLERAYGRPVREVFASIDAVPLGSASIGQVHRARLLDGREVAVKVQYPRVEALFRGDLRTIRRFCAIAQPEHLTVLDEVERAFLTEFAYDREAEALQTVADNVARSPFRARVVVPRPVMELCRREVLVMEYLDGEKLVNALRRRAIVMAEARGMNLEQLRAKWAAVAAASGAEGGPPTAPVPRPLWRRALLRSYLWVSDAAHNVPRALRNASWGRRSPMPMRHTPPPLDVESVLCLLSAVHAHQLFVDGLFNGDAHPGNVLLLRDGRLGLIDYGQACRLALGDRVRLARLMRALADEDAAAAVRLFRACGYQTVHSNDDLCYRAAVIAFDRDDREITGGLNVQAWFEAQAREDPCLHWPDEYVMASRNTILLRGMGIVLGRPMSVAKAWKSTVLAFLREHDAAAPSAS